MITVRLIIRPWEVNYTFISCCKRAKLIIKQSVRSLPLFIINLTLWKQRNSGRLDRRLGSFSSLLTWLICNEMKRKREISQWKKRREKRARPLWGYDEWKETSGMECSACSFHLIQQHTNEILFPSLICFLFFFALIQLNYKRKEVESVNLIEAKKGKRKQRCNCSVSIVRYQV